MQFSLKHLRDLFFDLGRVVLCQENVTEHAQRHNYLFTLLCWFDESGEINHNVCIHCNEEMTPNATVHCGSFMLCNTIVLI